MSAICIARECCVPSIFSRIISDIYSLVVECPFGVGTIGFDPIEAQIPATGGIEPYTYAITNGSIPIGLNFDSDTGIISGTPSAEGVFSFTVTVTDDSGTTASISCSVTVKAVPTGLVDYDGNPIYDYLGNYVGTYY